MLNILLVDDREENLIALDAVVRRKDLNVFKTTSPQEALKLAWENEIAIALVDVQMPGMDGFELVELLKANPRTQDIMVIFVTAISKEQKYALKGLNTGAVDYLFKPLDPYVTAAKVDSFVQLAKARREVVAKNKELENYAREVINSADIICRLDPDTLRILSVNPAVEKVLGYQPSQVIGRNLVDFTEDLGLSVTKNELEKMMREGRDHCTFEDRFRNFKQEVQWLQCRVKCSNDLFLINMSDVSIQKKYTDELIRSRDVAEQARRLKEGFLANMSHEIRTPINGVIGLTHILKDTELDEQQKKIVELISVSSQSLLGVINDILDLSKIEAGKFSIVKTETNLHFLLRSVCDILKFKALERGLSLMCEIEPKVPQFVLADSLRLNQVLMNLLSNALKFTEKGHVKLTVRASEWKADKVVLSFIVEDTGIGIAFDKLEHIFDSFSQAEDHTSTKYGGTGLGLTITKKLCELQGGNLLVSSLWGRGSVFTFVNEFTIVDQPNKGIEPDITIEPFANPVKLLLAEDNHINQFAAKNILKKWNVEMDIAENGLEAFEMLERNAYDIVLMDIHMPVMNGYEATRKIRSEMQGDKKHIPIISLSAAVLEEEVSEARESGMNDSVGKPFNPKLLYAKMKALLER